MSEFTFYQMLPLVCQSDHVGWAHCAKPTRMCALCQADSQGVRSTRPGRPHFMVRGYSVIEVLVNHKIREIDPMLYQR